MKKFGIINYPEKFAESRRCRYALFVRLSPVLQALL